MRITITLFWVAEARKLPQIIMILWPMFSSIVKPPHFICAIMIFTAAAAVSAEPLLTPFGNLSHVSVSAKKGLLNFLEGTQLEACLSASCYRKGIGQNSPWTYWRTLTEIRLVFALDSPELRTLVLAQRQFRRRYPGCPTHWAFGHSPWRGWDNTRDPQGCPPRSSRSAENIVAVCPRCRKGARNSDQTTCHAIEH